MDESARGAARDELEAAIHVCCSRSAAEYGGALDHGKRGPRPARSLLPAVPDERVTTDTEDFEATVGVARDGEIRGESSFAPDLACPREILLLPDVSERTVVDDREYLETPFAVSSDGRRRTCRDVDRLPIRRPRSIRSNLPAA